MDSARLDREYNQRAARILATRFDGSMEEWRRSYDAAWDRYREGIEVADWESREWVEIVDELDARLILDTLQAVGVKWRPLDVVSYSRDLEAQVVSFVASCHDDSKEALEELKKAGHSLYVATQVGEWNARAALNASGLALQIDGLFTGDSTNAHKHHARYWRNMLETSSLSASDCILADDQIECLRAAATEGIGGVLIDRKGESTSKELPRFIKMRLSGLSELSRAIKQKKL